MLVVQVSRFACELAAFADTLPHPDLATPLTRLADGLPALARGEPYVRIRTALAEALSTTAALLAATRAAGVAPGRFVSRLESRLTRLYGVGIGLPTHQQRPHGQATPSTRSLRGPRRRPMVRIAAFG